MEADRIKIIETVLTDSNERVLGNRMTTEEMLPALEKMDRVGFYAIECFAGQIFEQAFESLDDPWERLAAIRQQVTNTKLLLTMQGARIFSDELYPDAMVESFVDVCHENGIAIFRLYDRDNDFRRLSAAVSAAKRNGAEVQIAVVYRAEMRTEEIVKLAKEAEALGADAVTIRDADGVLPPYVAAELFCALSAEVSVPLGLQMHQTTGFAEMAYLKAAENGCSIFDTTTSPFFAAVSSPATEVITEAFEGTARAAGLDRAAIQAVNDHFHRLSENYKKSGIFGVDRMALDFEPETAEASTEADAMLYDDLTEDDVKRIRREIALVEKSTLDTVTYALYPTRAKDYFSRR